MSVLFLVAASSTAGEFGPACSTLTVVLRDLFGAMLRNFNKLQLKIGLLAYSPLGKPGRDSVHDMQLEFTGSWSSLEKSFESLCRQAQAGVSFPSLPDALDSALKLDWKGRTRTVVHLMLPGACLHGASSSLLGDQVRRLFLVCGVVRYYFLSSCSRDSDELLSQLKALAPDPSWVRAHDLEVEDPEDKAAYMEAALHESLHHALRTSMHAGVLKGQDRPFRCAPCGAPVRILRSPEDFHDPSSAKSWRTVHGTLKTSEVCRLGSVVASLVREGCLPDFPCSEEMITVQIADAPFHYGSLSRAHHAAVVNSPSRCSDGHPSTKLMILRQHAIPWDHFPWLGTVKLDADTALKLQCDISLVAKIVGMTFIAEAKEALRSELRRNQALHFPQVSLFQASESYDNQAQSWMLEDLFYDCETGEEAEFSVLSWNNVGYTLGCSDEDTPVPLLEALSHYSWHKSQGRMLVLFTKGGRCDYPKDPTKARYVATRPVIHSEHIFLDSPTNFGHHGIEGFFSSHTCGGVCQGLGILPAANSHGPAVMHEKTRSSKHPASSMTHGAEGLPWAVLRCQKGDGDDVIAAGLNVEALRALQGDTNEHSSGSEDEDGLTVVSEATTARLDALANQVKYHKHLIRKLRAAGYTQENFSNFCHSIKFARDAKVITPEKADRYFALNKHGNKAKHELDSKCYKI